MSTQTLLSKKQPTVHLFDTHEVPHAGAQILTNCGRRAIFIPMHLSASDGTVCAECLLKTSENYHRLRTFAISPRNGNKGSNK